MSFLQPWMLFALPLALLPIIIHLINQRRYQTTRWAAMMFLLAANRMNRGYARIRQWMILALRTSVIAALVFAVGRPLSSGLLGGAISGAAATNSIVLLDRSPSMQERVAGSSLSKLETGLGNIAETLGTMGARRVVLIESNFAQPRELESPASLLDLPQAGPSDASADIPAMMLSALDYLQANKLGQCEIWICSDLREQDWRANDGRWASLRDSFGEFGRRVRFRLLAFAEKHSSNRAVRVNDVRLSDRDNDPVVSMSINLTGDHASSGGEPETIPVSVEIEGTRSTVDVNFDGSTGELKGHRIALPRGQVRGWGRISIPADANAADNDFNFTFDVAPPRRTVIVTKDADIGRVLQLAAEITSEEDIQSTAEVISPEAIDSVDWTAVALVLWQGELREEDAKRLESFVERGGSLMFLPPEEGSGDLAFGIGWGKWIESEEAVAVAGWRGDTDLLSVTMAGTALPVGSLRVERFAQIRGDATALATLADGSPLLVRVPTPGGAVYALATTPRVSDSSLAVDGVMLYVMTQRALESGSRSLSETGQLDAGELDASIAGNLIALSGRDDRLSTEYTFNAGVYENDGRWFAVNRSSAEDQASTVSESQVDGLFRDLLLERIDQQTGVAGAIVEEVWRAFLIIMLIAMIGEACLCLPRRPTDEASSTIKGLAS